MKVKVIESKRNKAWGYTGDLKPNKIYNVVSTERDCYRIVDESGEDYLYSKDIFEVVEK